MYLYATFFTHLYIFYVMCENPFLDLVKPVDFLENGCIRKQPTICNTKLKKYSLKCDKVLYGCDEIKAISPNDNLKYLPCFSLVSNDTNSKDLIIPIDNFSSDTLSGVSITLDCFPTFNLYKVVGVYEGQPLDLIDFKFYFENSSRVQQNGYKSDILIHGKAFRLEVISGGDFSILTFLNELLRFGIYRQERALEALGDYYITRYDYRFDFFCPNKSMLCYYDCFTIASRLKHENIVKDKYSKKIYTGWTAGERKNRYVYTRMYQKQVEILDHNLECIYPDYISYEGQVWRLEFELGSVFTVKARGKHFLVDEFVDYKLEQMLFEYVGINPISGYFSCPKSKLLVPFDMLTLGAKKQRLSMFRNTGKSLLKCGHNPYCVLEGELSKSFFPEELDELRKEFYDSSISDNRDLVIANDLAQNNRSHQYEKIFKLQQD